MVCNLVCNRCKHVWEYAGNKHRTSCPKCKTSVTLLGLDSTFQEIHKVLNHPTTEFILPLKVIDSHQWSKVVGNARYLGDPIILVSNKDGKLNLKV